MKKSGLSILVILVILTAVFFVFQKPSHTANGGTSEAAERQSNEKVASIDENDASRNEGEQVRESRRHAENALNRAKIRAGFAAERNLIQLRSQLELLRKYKDDQLLVYAAGLDVANNEIREIYPMFLEAKRDLEALKINGLGEAHPTVVEKVNQIDRTKKQLDESVAKLRSHFEEQVDSASEKVK